MAHFQGTNSTNPFWDFVSGLLKNPSPEQEACHAPKPILLDTGEVRTVNCTDYFLIVNIFWVFFQIDFPYKWHPDIIDTQMLKIGNLLIAALPGEFTTMSGRRMRESVQNMALEVTQGSEDTVVVLAGLSNVYTHYITTFEEYQRQRYEAASTIYGPYTLDAYLQQYRYLTAKILNV